jgi:hypothetical protein
VRRNYVFVTCALRLQMMPLVVLSAGDLRIPIPGRAVGSLTGSHVAGACGRVPVESTIRDRHVHWQEWGFQADSRVLTTACYVDNI